MIKFITYISVLKNDLINGNLNRKSLKFFRNTNISVIVWFILIEGFYKRQDTNLESIIDEVNKLSKISRPTIVKILENAISLKLVIKEKSKFDARKMLFKPSSLTINEFEEWSDNLFNLRY